MRAFLDNPDVALGTQAVGFEGGLACEAAAAAHHIEEVRVSRVLLIAGSIKNKRLQFRNLTLIRDLNHHLLVNRTLELNQKIQSP